MERYGPLPNEPIVSPARWANSLIISQGQRTSMKISCASAAMLLSFVVCGCANQLPTGDSTPGTIMSEGFESTQVGAIPAGFTKTGEIGVEEGVAHSGT